MVTSLPYFICVFALLINKASLQVTVEGFIGGSALLPCSSTEDAHEQDIYVHWRDGNGKSVIDIVKGEALAEHDQWYKNRVESFPEEYLRRNFSIKLNELRLTDAGKYTCLISHSSEQPAVRLIISESITENRNKPSEPDEQIEETGSDMESSSSFLWVYITSIVIIIGVIIIVVLFHFRKKIQSAFSPVRSENTDDTDK